MNVAEASYVSCFAGAGGLDLGLRIAVPNTRCLGYVEINIEAAEVLAARIEEGSLDEAPIFSDVRTFPSEDYRGRVAGIVAGFPCPDYSVAGKRAGIVGKHGQLWDYLAIAIRDVGPDWVLLENVSGILVPHGAEDESGTLPAGLWFVLGDLAALGFDAEWVCLRASDVGASHARMRWFCLAYRPGRRLGILRESSGSNGLADGGDGELGYATGDDERRESISAMHREGIATGGSGSEELGNPERSRRKTGSGRQVNTGGEPSRGCGEMGHPNQPGLEGRDERGLRSADERIAGQAGDSELAEPDRSGAGVRTGDDEETAEGATGERTDIGAGIPDGHRLPLFAPGPSDPRWPAILVEYPWLAPAISEEEAQSTLRGMADGVARMVADERTDALRAIGNGVVPLQVAAAITGLSRRAALDIQT